MLSPARGRKGGGPRAGPCCNTNEFKNHKCYQTDNLTGGREKKMLTFLSTRASVAARNTWLWVQSSCRVQPRDQMSAGDKGAQAVRKALGHVRMALSYIRRRAICNQGCP